MILFNELEKIYKEAIAEEGDDESSDLSLTVKHLYPGVVYLMMAAVLENVAVYVTLAAYRHFLVKFDSKVANKKKSADATTARRLAI